MAKRRHPVHIPLEYPNGHMPFSKLSRLPITVMEMVDPDDPDLDYIAEALTAMIHVGFEVDDPMTVQMAIAAARRRSSLAAEEARAVPYNKRLEEIARANAWERSQREYRSVVYYARMRDLVKIGYSKNVKQRVSQLGVEELMATEQGGLMKEAERHNQFRELRHHGEWFLLEGPLVDHIRALQAQKAVA